MIYHLIIHVPHDAEVVETDTSVVEKKYIARVRISMKKTMFKNLHQIRLIKSFCQIMPVFYISRHLCNLLPHFILYSQDTRPAEIPYHFWHKYGLGSLKHLPESLC